MQMTRWFRGAALAVLLALTVAGPAAAQEAEETRPAGVTFLGDTGLWFVPTAEVVPHGRVSASGQLATLNRQEGFTAIQTAAATFAAGIGDRAEIFGSIPFVTRIDRDVRPLFRSSPAATGGPALDYPLATEPFSGNAMGDVVVGIKINLASERTQAPAAAAIRGWAQLPTGSEAVGASTGTVGGGIGLVVSKDAGQAEVAAHGGFRFRGDPAGIDLPNGIRWGVGLGAPVRGAVRFFGELLGEQLLGNEITLDNPLTAADGSMSGLSSPIRSPLDVVLGLQVQGRGVSFGGGVTWAPLHESRSSIGLDPPRSEPLSFLLRLSYHPGVRVYVPPPPPPPPPEPNRPPTVTVSCDPCEVETNETVNLRADASDPDGDPLTYRWNAPAGQFTSGTSGATTTWQAPDDPGSVPISVTVTDGNGGSASDTANITVNAPPPPPREWVFEDVHFDFDRYTLRPVALEVLNEVVAAMMEDPSFTIQVEGHTCNIGTNEYNLALGDRRADAVQSYLTDRGVDGDRLQTITYGEERPEHDNAREETRRLNRRAALVVRLQQ